MKPVDDYILIPCQFEISFDRTSNNNNLWQYELPISICNTFQPYILNEERFLEELNKKSNQWIIEMIQISISCKPKVAFKALSSYMNANIIETESDKAICMSCKTTSFPYNNEGLIFILAKIINNNNMQIEIKCHSNGSTTQDSLKVIKLIIQSLNNDFNI